MEGKWPLELRRNKGGGRLHHQLYPSWKHVERRNKWQFSDNCGHPPWLQRQPPARNGPYKRSSLPRNALESERIPNPKRPTDDAPTTNATPLKIRDRLIKSNWKYRLKRNNRLTCVHAKKIKQDYQYLIIHIFGQ